MKNKICGAIFTVLTSMLIGQASAQTYPARPIRLIVPYTPGGSIDTTARIVADQLQKQLGQPIVIENKPGASGLIGSLEVAKAKPDGYTLLFNASGQVYLPLVMEGKTYDAEKDFTPIAQVGYVPLAVLVSVNEKINSLKELVALAQANPKKYTWATSGFGTTSHLSEEILTRELKLNMDIIPYKGASPQLTDVMGGHVTAAISPLPGATPFIEGKRLKVLAITSKERVPTMPDVPTVSETVLPGFEIKSWYGLWGPANLPAEIVTTLSREVNKATQDPAVLAKFEKLSFQTQPNTPEEFKKIISNEIALVGKVARQANILIKR